MKILKILFTSCLAMTFISLSAQQVNDLTVVKQIDPKEATQIYLDLEGEIATEYWDKNYIRIEIGINSNFNAKETLRYLVSKKRYSPVTHHHFTGMTISMPLLAKPVRINNQKFKEEVSYKIYIPIEMTDHIFSKDFDLITGIE